MQPSFSTSLNLVFLIFVWTQSNFSSAWYDNQISFFFVFFSHDLSAPDNDAYHRWLSKLKHHFSCRKCFERVIFWSRVVHTIYVSKKWLWLKRVVHTISVNKKEVWLKGLFTLSARKRVMAQKIVEEWAIVFLVNMPQWWFWNIVVLRLIFSIIERRFGRLEAIASLNAYQITKNQILQKFIFFVAWFSKNSRKSFWIRNFIIHCLNRRDQRVDLIFQNRAPWGIKVFFIQKIPKWKKVFIKMDWLLTMITNSFKIPITKNLKTFFYHFLHWLYDHEVHSPS